MTLVLMRRRFLSSRTVHSAALKSMDWGGQSFAFKAGCLPDAHPSRQLEGRAAGT
jgi:hypothetical protein